MKPAVSIAVICVVLSVAGAGPAAAQTPSPDPDLVAAVGDSLIRLGDVEEKRRELDPGTYLRLEEAIREGRRRALEELIAGALLARHAREGGVEVDDLLSQVDAKVKAPTPEEVDEMYRASAVARQGASLQPIAASIEAYVKQQKVSDARRRFIAGLRNDYPVQIVASFEAPRQLVSRSSRDGVRGSESAPVEIIEFSDFECPYCRQLAPILQQLLEKYSADVRLVWKHYPLAIHPNARAAAEASACAADQRGFWVYHDLLFANQAALTRPGFSRLALEAGLDAKAFQSCVDEARHRDDVAADLRQGRELGVNATPTVFINGRMVTGAASFDAYDRIVREELESSRRVPTCAGDMCTVGTPGRK